jgi:predicted GNAT family acetyltransferase
MTIRVTSDAAEFRTTVFPFLERDPVLNTLILSNVAERANGTNRSESGPAVYVSVYDDAGEVVGAAMRTPNRPVYLGGLREDLGRDVADAVAGHLPDLAGVAGAAGATQAFADRWGERFGTTSTAGKSTRLHKLVDLVRLTAPGVPRQATEADVQLAAEWVAVDFGDDLGDATEEWARRHVDRGTLWFWEVDGVPVSMVGHHLPTFGVSRIGPVYTPDEHRRHGYASALTAHITELILDRGNQACLYTDLANPTSNKIYAQLGYVPVADFIDLTFKA